MVATRTPDVDAPAARTGKIIWLLPILSVAWLLIKLWASRGQIRNSEDGTVALATAAGALPGVVQASIVAGAGLALVADALAARTLIRWLIRLGAGLVTGGIGAALVIIAYPHLPWVGSIGATLVIASLIGAALTGIPRVGLGVAAGVAAMLAALVVTTILNSKNVLTHMLTWFGAGTTADSFVHASKLVQYADYTLIGIVAGVTAFSYLRRATATWFPLYLIGGALSGTLMLIGFGLTSIGGARLNDAANALSEADRILNQLESSESVPNAMIVLFVGAFVALFAVRPDAQARVRAGRGAGRRCETSLRKADSRDAAVRKASRFNQAGRCETSRLNSGGHHQAGRCNQSGRCETGRLDQDGLDQDGPH